MDIDRIRYFHVFADTGSLVKASEILHISQPALSKALKVLASEVGVVLLEQDGRGLRLTEMGRSFKRETAPLLQQWLSIPQKIRGLARNSPTRIGSFEVFTTYFLGHLIEYVELQDLEVHEFGPGRMEQALIDDKVDIGITYAPIPFSGIDFTEVTKIKMGVFGLSAKFSQESFDSLPFVIPIIPMEGTPTKVMGLDGWPDHKFPRKVQYRVTMMESAMELCRRGHAVAYLPEFVVRLHNQNVKAHAKLEELEAPVSRKDRQQSVFLVKRHQSKDSKLEMQIAKCLRSLT